MDRFGRKEAQTWVQLSTGAESLPFVNKRACSLISLFHFVSLLPHTGTRSSQHLLHHPSSSSSTSISRPLFPIFPLLALPVISLSHPPLLFSLAFLSLRVFNRVPPLPPSLSPLFIIHPGASIFFPPPPPPSFVPGDELFFRGTPLQIYPHGTRRTSRPQSTDAATPPPPPPPLAAAAVVVVAPDRSAAVERRRDATARKKERRNFKFRICAQRESRWTCHRSMVAEPGPPRSALGPRVSTRKQETRRCPRAALLCCSRRASNNRDCPDLTRIFHGG